MGLKETADAFFIACETGKGWNVCKDYCHAQASFTCQAGALADIKTAQAYCGWMAGLLGPLRDAHYELTSFSVDEASGVAIATAVFVGTHTGSGGPIAPTGKQTRSDYAYVMHFDGDKINHIAKIWNDTYALAELGWG